VVEGLRELVDLSRFDAELRTFEEELAGLPGRRAAVADRRAESLSQLEAAQEAVTEAEQAQRRAEGEARDQEAVLARLEGQQFQVKSNVAYTALLHEMDQAKGAISEAETRILEAMEAIEQARAALAAAEERGRSIESHLVEEERGCDEREKVLREQISQVEERRDALRGRLDEVLLARYDKIAARRSPAVAIVAKETCLGCRVGIPPQAAIEMRKGEVIITCGHCQRILIHEDQLEGP